MNIFSRFILIFILLFVLLSCNSKERRMYQYINQWIGEEIKMPDLELKFIGEDTICNDLWTKKYRLLTYVDTAGCVPCKFHPIEWRAIIKEAKEMALDLSFIFIVSSSDYELFEKMEKVNYFNFPVYYDPLMKFKTVNRLPKENYLHTFLLDSSNKIIALGSPVLNDEVWELYIETIQKP